MRKYLLIVVFFVFVVTDTFAQVQNNSEVAVPDSEYYFMRDSRTIAATQNTAKFIRLYTKANLGMYKVEEFYLNDKPKLVAKTFRREIDFQSGIDGYCMEYYSNGNRKSIKNYNRGVVIGEAVEYYLNGNVYNITESGEDGIYLKSCSDSTGKSLAENGNGIWLKIKNDGDNSIYLTGPVVNGKADGVWKKHISDTTFTIVYKKGEIISGRQYVDEIAPFLHIKQAPQFLGKDKEFGAFLGRNIKYTSVDSDNPARGRIIVKFAVDTDGSVNDVSIVRGINKYVDAEVIRVVKKSPRWKPALEDGRPKKVLFAIPINFDLSQGGIQIGSPEY